MDFINKPIFGMLHMYGDERAPDIASDEIEVYLQEGVDGFIIENYGCGLDEIRKLLGWIDEVDERLYKGINILPNEIVTAYELAAAYKLDFIQFDYVSGNYANTKSFDYDTFIRFRKRFPEIKILGGVWPKYYKPIEDSDLLEDIDEAKGVCDAIVVTGSGTGKETPLDKIKKFRNIAGDFPLIVGAGLTPQNVCEQLTIADGGIVGSTFKKYGHTSNPVNKELVREFMSEVKKVRENSKI